MDFSSNIDLIIRELTEVCEIIDDLKNYPGVPSFQIEIAKSKCRGAAELIALLKNIRDKEQPVAEEKTAPAPVIEHKPEVAKIIHTDHTPEKTVAVTTVFELSDEKSESPKAEEKEKEITMAVEIIKEDKAVEKAVTKETRENTEIKTERKEPDRNQEKAPAQSIIADRFSSVTGSIYEQIGKASGTDDTAEKILAKPVASLTDAIGLNDKFLFIGELFKGDKDAYLKAITRLDNTETYNEARSIAMSFNNGNDESEAIKHLLMIIKRKHPSNE